MMAFSDKARLDLTATEKAEMAASLIPRSSLPGASSAERDSEQAWAATNHVHGYSDAAMYKHLAVQREEGQVPTIPMPSLPAMTAPGTTGERIERLQQCLQCHTWGTGGACVEHLMFSQCELLVALCWAAHAGCLTLRWYSCAMAVKNAQRTRTVSGFGILLTIVQNMVELVVARRRWLSSH